MNDLTINKLLKNAKKQLNSSQQVIKIAVLGDSSTQLFAKALKGYAFEYGLNFDIYEADYASIELEVYNTAAKLYQIEPQFVIFYQSSLPLHKKFLSTDIKEKALFGDKILNNLQNYIEAINTRINTKIILFNYGELDDLTFGNYGNKTKDSWIYQLRNINFHLMNLSQQINNVYINDMAVLQSYLGYQKTYDIRTYIRTDITTNLDSIPFIAKNCFDIISASIGRFKKCLILDLDNTTWGGIIGDDGIDKIQIGTLGIGKAFTELQLWAKSLKDRGIILAICSKNTESIAKEPFEHHPDMILRLSDIAVFVANWENKADNIRHIQSILNIGFDSMVFLDDNSFERNLVRLELPEVTVPELPVDPSDYVSYLRMLNLFETASYSTIDSNRTQKYQEEAKRRNLKTSFKTLDAYLENLAMKATIKPFDVFNLPRIAQLTQRSNQFNLRTIRYTEKDVERVMASNKYITRYISLEDKLGTYGLISLVILEELNKNTLFIDTWIMSCRVLKRGVEKFFLNEIVVAAKSRGYQFLEGERIPTTKNELVKDHYKNLGFKEKDGKWILEITDYVSLKNHISKKVIEAELVIKEG